MSKMFIITLISSAVLLSACNAVTVNPEESVDDQGSVESVSINQEETMPVDLVVKDSTVGDGQEAVSGKVVSVHYTGTLTDGSKFDSSVDRGEPFEFTLGVGQVIPGWDQGVAGMKVGGKRQLTIPPELAYGDQNIPGIPAGSTLVFEVELLEVK